MKYLICASLACLLFSACGKNKAVPMASCERKTTVVLERPVNQTGSLRQEGNQHIIVPAGTIDSRYVPCNLPDSLRGATANVVFSGTVYQTTWENGQPCCTYALELTAIRRL